MRDYIIVQQGIDPLSVRAASIENPSVLAQYMLPAGSQWSHFVGARCFKLTEINPDIYLLSFTVVLDTLVLEEEGRLPAGTLHAWGIVGSPAEFLTNFRHGVSVVEIFKTHTQLFSSDVLADEMLKHLEQGRRHPRIKRGFWWGVSKLLLQFGIPLRLAYPFLGLQSWLLVEDSIEDAFYSTLWKAKLRQYLGFVPKLSTFITFTLSLTDSAQIRAVPQALGQASYYGGYYGGR
jgi:hypothetical protein